ncbi:hypothetical protein GCM10010523_26840 [Paenarthrobacter ilicis]
MPLRSSAARSREPRVQGTRGGTGWTKGDAGRTSGPPGTVLALVRGDQAEGNGVDAEPLIGGVVIALTLEHMSKV